MQMKTIAEQKRTGTNHNDKILAVVGRKNPNNET